MKVPSYFDHAARLPVPDVYELSRAAQEPEPYTPRPEDVVEFEADERAQHVVLASPSAGTQPPHAAHDGGHGVAAESDSAGRSRRDRLSESYE